jgi:hypothetical protein
MGSLATRDSGLGHEKLVSCPPEKLDSSLGADLNAECEQESTQMEGVAR